MGHADFSTTANIYSHLDYTSKLQSANAISGAFAKKLQIQEEENDDIEPIYNSIRKDMERLGIRTFEDYAIYLEEQKNIPKLAKKSEMEM